MPLRIKTTYGLRIQNVKKLGVEGMRFTYNRYYNIVILCMAKLAFTVPIDIGFSMNPKIHRVYIVYVLQTKCVFRQSIH